MTGLGGGLGYTTSLVVVGFNFKKRRSVAIGFAVSGVGAGLFLLAPVMQFARDFYGDFGFFVFMSGMMFHIVVFGAMCFPSSLEKYTQIKRRIEVKKKAQSSTIDTLVSSLKPYMKVLLNKGIVCLCLAMFGFCLGTYLVYLHLPKYIIFKGFSPLEAASLLSLSGIMSVLGRFLTGVIANFKRLNNMIPYAGSMVVVAIATFIYPFASRLYVGQISYVVLLGLFFGSCYVMTTNVTLNFVDISYMSAAIGLEFMFGGLGSLIGPVFAGR